MTHQEAYKILGLSMNPSPAELETAFRGLIKTYHPDKNLDRSEWSHRATIMLNEAYEVARLHLRFVRAENFPDSPPLTPKPAGSAQTKSFHAEFAGAREYILDAIHLYYNFGLDNIHLRKEGIRRFRYRTALAQVKKGVRSLNFLAASAPSRNQQKHAELLLAFGRSFLENIQIEKTFIPDGSLNHKAYRTYESGSRILDALIKNCFYPGEFSNSDPSPKNANLCERNFFLVLTQYGESSWIAETVIKISLLESLLNLINFETGLIR